jgi:hypothetical protein
MTLSRVLTATACASLSLSLAACGGTTSKPTLLPNDLKSPFTGYTSRTYSDASKWLCLPGRADACHRDLTATEIRSDGTRAILTHVIAKDADVDCFYVYPTVDDRLFVAANHEDFTDKKEIEFATSAQAAQFGQVCSLYVPFYRQITMGTYFRSPEQREAGLSVAFSDIADAFLHYMASYNHGRKVVLLGHSQGADMVKRLLTRYFDDDPQMRDRLLLAMPIGGDLDVASGKTTGGSFKNIPMCTRDDEVGCVVAYRSHRDWSHGVSIQHPEPGHQAMCVNPGSIADARARAPLQAYFPNYERLLGLEGIKTPFVFYRDLYSSRCVDGPDGRRVLEISEEDEPDGLRQPPIDLSAWRWGTKMGTHGIDMQFPQGNLIEMVRKRVRTLK